MDVAVEGEGSLKNLHFSLEISEALATDRRHTSPQEDGTRQRLLLLWDGGLVETLSAGMYYGEIHLGAGEGSDGGGPEWNFGE
jgi:hypothetical protein